MGIQLLMQSAFKPFGAEHLTVIGLTVCLCTGLSLWVRQSRSQCVKQAICISIAVVLLSAEWFNYAWVLVHEGWMNFVDHSLPLHVCGFTLYLAVFVLITRNRYAFQLLYFWAFAGTVQALLTPVDQEGFPAWDCFHFFIIHGGVIVGAAVATFGMEMRPTRKGLAGAYVLSWVMVLVVGGINALLGTNYMYLCAPPSGSTPFYFLPWPWYILFLGLLALVFFTLLWLPFAGSGGEKASNAMKNAI